MFMEWVYSFVGNKPWKVTVLMAGVHGNEPTWIETLQLFREFCQIDGWIVHIIFANIQAIQESKRYIDVNMNRYFQEWNSWDTYEIKRIEEILPYLHDADFLLDIHNTERENTEAFLLSSHSEVYKLFPVEKIINNIDDFEQWWSDGFMDRNWKVWICFEAGSFLGWLSIDEMQKIIHNFLIWTGNIDWEVVYIAWNQIILETTFQYIAQTDHCELITWFGDFTFLTVWTVIGKDWENIISAPHDWYIFFAHQKGKIGKEMFCFAKICAWK